MRSGICPRVCSGCSRPHVLGYRRLGHKVRITFQILRGVEEQVESNHVRGDQSILVPWPWDPVKSREIARVRVRCYGIQQAEGKETLSPWSEWSTTEASLLHQEDWKASFITSTRPIDLAQPLAPIQFCKQFRLPTTTQPRLRARLYITSLGVYITISTASDLETSSWHLGGPLTTTVSTSRPST